MLRVTRKSDPASGRMAVPLATGRIRRASEPDSPAGIRRVWAHRRVVLLHRAPLQQLAQAVWTDLDAILA